MTHSNSNPRSGRFLFVCSTPDWCCRIGPVAFALWRVGVLQQRDFDGLFPATVYHRMWWSVSFLRSLVTGPLCTHQVFPELRDGNRTVFISLSKDIPSVVSIAGFECCVWYRQSSKAFTVHFTVVNQKRWHEINNDADLFTFPSNLMQKQFKYF